MQICQNCKHENREGSLLCEHCGQLTIPTDTISATQPAHLQTELESATYSPPPGEERMLIFQLLEAQQSVVVAPSAYQSLGRADAALTHKVDIDLTPYNALQNGVSRIHAAVYFNDDIMYLIDLASRNGTYLNGKRLSPEEPYIIRDGDVVRLGTMSMRIYLRERSPQAPSSQRGP